MLRAFSSVYTSGVADAQRFWPVDHRDRDARIRRTCDAASKRIDRALLDELSAQQAALPSSAARDARLAELREGAAAVITGQQVGLFLGPLYTVAKAASAVVHARMLAEESGARVVPLFWLQTEDHDYAEIDHCDLRDEQGRPLRVALPDRDGAGAGRDARSSVEHRRLDERTGAALATVEGALAKHPHAAEVMALLRRHYRPHASLSGAFAGVLAELFADEGLLVLDPRREAVARVAATTLGRALVDAEAIEARLRERCAALHACTIAVQIEPRDGATLLFFHEGAVDGPRYRIERDGAGGEGELRAGNSRFTRGELLELLRTEPLRFSTSALLRPLVQDALLPTAAYVGGPGEIGYFAELAPLYELLGIAPPLLLHRARIRVIDARTHARLDALGLAASELAQPRDALLARLAERVHGDAPSPSAVAERARSGLAAVLDGLERDVLGPGGDLDRAARRTRGTATRAIDRLLARYTRSIVERDAVSARRLDQVLAALVPDGAPQERRYGFLEYAARLGPRELVRRVLSSVRPPWEDPDVAEVDA